MKVSRSPIVSIRDVTYWYPGAERPALRDFTLDVEDGEFLLVTGVSGAGKSTLLRLFNGLVPHFYGGELSGAITVDGRDPVAEGPGEMSDTVGLVFQDPEAQFAADIVEDEIAFALENAGVALPTMRKRVEEALHALSIEQLRNRRASTLSGGERQRVAIAAALVLQPKIVILDEPTSQLDPQSAEEVLDALVKLNKDLGLTVILSEHRLERVVQYADRMLYMAQNALPITGEPAEVLAKVPLAPPLAQVGKLLDWKPLPLTIKEARRFVELSAFEAGPGVIEGNETPGEAGGTGTQRTISLRDVWFGYGGREVLHGLNLEIRAGEITALMGRNGAGKTSILKLMLGLLKPGRGRVNTLGVNVKTASLDEIARLVGYVPQQPDLLLFADSVQGEIDFTRRAHGLPPDGVSLLASLGLLKYREADPRDLSVGERQRVALAAVLAGNPQAVLLDEPTRGLDYLQKAALVASLRGLCSEGKLVLLATHDVELAAQLAERVVLLGDGEVIADGPAREVMSDSLAFSSQISKLFRNPALITVEDVERAIAPLSPSTEYSR